ncbi:hypothetical protein [Arthrobacter gandavensis]|uniref:hypothetical protein n=1 Tax=Arthrobacter gandavensis TaxID=169960 RepID=UPI001E47AE22|nr:hypothetical protein [Arthrobacter gandavensis]
MSRLDRAAEKIMDWESPAYGDERERSVFMESNAFGLTVGLYSGLLGAVIAAGFGLFLLPTALLVLTGVVPSLAAVWYARRHGVNPRQLADNAGARFTMVGIVVFGIGMVLVFAAMAYAVFTGHPLINPLRFTLTPGEGFVGGMAQGAVVGGMIGGAAAVAGGISGYRRANGGRPGRKG